eukprot:NP_001022839.1 Arf-GAP with ANK repeat and PH domain-containing protein cnt-2 [Caenorhabditis elegans]
MSRHLLTGGNNTLHSEQIRSEIQRFESVHPCIYQHNADAQILDNNGRSCLFYARSNGFREVFDMLVTAGLSPDYGLPQEINDFSQMPEFFAMGSTSNRDYSTSGDEMYGSRRISMGPPPQVPARRYLPQQPELDETSVI